MLYPPPAPLLGAGVADEPKLEPGVSPGMV
jgi:hypothetical protein